MRYVLDARIAIASMRPSERLHSVSKRRLDRVLGGVDDLVVPAIFPVEVTAGLSRGGLPPALVARFVDALLANAKLVTIGPLGARKIARVAMQTRLCAADAAYVWVAQRDGLTLVTDDREMLERATAHCGVEAP